VSEQDPSTPREDGSPTGDPDAPGTPAPGEVDPPAWTSPAANAIPPVVDGPLEREAERESRGGWFGRFRRGSRHDAGMPDEPWQSPGGAGSPDEVPPPTPRVPPARDPAAATAPAEPDLDETAAPTQPPRVPAWRFGAPGSTESPVPAPAPSLLDPPGGASDGEDLPPEAPPPEAQPDEEPPPDAPPADEPPLPPLTAVAGEMPLLEPELETPEERAEEEREAQEILRGGPFSRFAWPSHPRFWNGYLAVLTGIVTLSFLMFVLVEPSPRWLLLIAAGAVVAGMDGVLRATWRASFAGGEDTTPYLFLPALYVFAAPLLIEHNFTGHIVLLWTILAGAGFGAIAVAEVLSVRTGSRLYPYARMVTSGAAYFSAFSLLAMTTVLHLGLLPAVVAAWLIGTMLAIEIVREGEVDPVETTVFAALAGLVVAQVRWLLFFLPIDGYLAGLALVLVFYLVTGVLHSYVLRQLTGMIAAEYAAVTAIGVALVVAARAAGLA